MPVLETRLYDREAFRAIFSFGGSVAGLADKSVSNLAAAIRNADAFAGEIVDTLRVGKREAASMSDRADPLDDLAEFKPGPTAPTAPRDRIRDASELAGFPSRAPRRWRTGRNTQLNLKVSADVLARFATLADRRRVPFGALLEQLLDEVGT